MGYTRKHVCSVTRNSFLWTIQDLSNRERLKQQQKHTEKIFRQIILKGAEGVAAEDNKR